MAPCSPWSSSKLPPCLPVSRAGRCQRTASAKTGSSKWVWDGQLYDQMISHDIKWLCMYCTKNQQHMKYLRHPSTFMCMTFQRKKKQLKAGSFHVLENYADNILHSASFVLQRFFAPSTHVITLKTLLQPSTSLPGLAAKRASSMPKADLPMPWHFPLTSAGYHFTVSVKVTLESGEPMIAMAGANVWSVVFFGFVFVRCCWSRKRTANPMGGMGNTRACRRNLGWFRKIQHGDVITHPYCGDLMWDLEWSGESHLTIKGCPWSMFPSLDLSRSQCIPLCSPPLANWPCSRAQRKRDGCEEALAPGKVQTTGCTGCSCCDGTDGTVPGIHGTQA